MAESRHTTMQRVQVGLVGLIVVLLFVSLANMALDRVSDAPVSADTTSAMPDSVVNSEATPKAGEPLAELGVAPVSKDAAQTAPAPDTANMRAAPAPQER